MYIYIYIYKICSICIYIYIYVTRCDHALVQGHTFPHSTALCPSVDPF